MRLNFGQRFKFLPMYVGREKTMNAFCAELCSDAILPFTFFLAQAFFAVLVFLQLSESVASLRSC
jgi:hypothetical protein